MYFYCVLFFNICVISIQVLADRGSQCDNCVSVKDCTRVRGLSRREKADFINAYSCEGGQGGALDFLFGFAATAKGDFVCCPRSNRKDNRNSFEENQPLLFPGDSNGDFTKGRPEFNTGSQFNIDSTTPGRSWNESPGYNSQGQCQALTSFPPDPVSGCCGREAIDEDRIVGGSTSDLEQYPWTVYVETTFKYERRTAAFSCGGALISARYVLTAAHCINDPDGTVNKVAVTLAEQDRRSFPMDCISLNGERRCIENILIVAEKVTAHPQFESTQLKNDVALIRLSQRAPYSDFIRPICIAPFNVDMAKFKNLPLAVAGWGRNGRRQSYLKLHTVLNLVPQRSCREYYPQLTEHHLCAAGYSGEDTCKGDSGGPLMMLYEGKYFVVGIVSGKRSDAPCGNSVPSLYTNVYRYVDWIRSVIRT